MEELSTKQQTLIRYIYNETTFNEELAIKSLISSNTSLQEEYEMLKKGKQALPKALFNPSMAALDNIMKYSRSTAPEHHC